MACVCVRALDLAHLVDLGLVHALERVGLLLPVGAPPRLCRRHDEPHRAEAAHAEARLPLEAR